MKTGLHITGLSVKIGSETLVDNVALDIGPGEICGIAGESGSGKSMTALSIMGLLPMGAERSGTAQFDDIALFAQNEQQMCALRGRRISMVFQEPMTALNPVRTIGDQVAETLIVHGVASAAEAREIAAEKLNRVGLPASQFSLRRFPHELSGGQRQRVMIAQAIALQPGLLIADEPTTALDVTTQAGILELLAELVDESGMSMLLITHDLGVLAGISHTINIMQTGSIVEAGPTENLFRQRRHSYTRHLFKASRHVAKKHRTKPPSDTLLKVENVTLGYRGKRASLFGKAAIIPAVKDISFSVKSGASLGIVGESGCGKSTLARAILGLEPLHEGRISLAGKPIIASQQMPSDLRAAMQIVFQDPYGSFNPRHLVGRLIAEPLHLTSKSTDTSLREAEIDRALEEVGLAPSDKHKFIHEFSGGQRQRIALARALVIRPELIILDEAVSALDVSIRAQIIDLLVDLRERQNLTYIFISHDLSVVRSVTDNVLVMKAGQIVEEGRTDKVLSAPAHSYTQTLIAATPYIPKDWLDDSPKTNSVKGA
jgi:peptide/nickel transport system ATP-binding protein